MSNSESDVAHVIVIVVTLCNTRFAAKCKTCILTWGSKN